MRTRFLLIAAAFLLLMLPSPASAGPPPGGIRLDESYGQSTTYLSRCSLLRKEAIWNC
jgi:hypothetical protein